MSAPHAERVFRGGLWSVRCCLAGRCDVTSRNDSLVSKEAGRARGLALATRIGAEDNDCHAVPDHEALANAAHQPHRLR